MNPRIHELREVVQKLVPLLAGKGLKVTQRGARAYVSVDPATQKPVSVNIPMIPETAEDDFIQAIQGFIDHEIGHVLITDWKYYGGGPTQKELQDPKVRSFMDTHNIVEDTMIEREIVKIFPGSKANISQLREHFLRKITKPTVDKTKTPKDAFIYLLVPTMRALAGHQEFQDYMDNDGHWSNPYVKALVDQLDADYLKRLRTCTNTKETLELTKELHAILFPPTPPEPPAPPPPKSKDKSEDKPEKKAGEGEGDGERDHSDEDPQDPEEDESEASDGKKDKEDKKDKDEEKSEDDAEDGAEEDGDDDGDDEEKSEKDKKDKEEQKDDAEDDGDDDGDGDSEDGDAEDADADDEEEDADDAEGSGGDDTDEEDADDGDAGAESEADGDGDDDADAGEDTDKESGASGAESGGELKDKSSTELDDTEGEEESGGGGIGTEVAKSMFDFDEDAFEAADMSSKISEMISETIIGELAATGEYMPYTLEFDRIEPLTPPEGMNQAWVTKMDEEVASMTGRMQKDIERIMASQSHVVRTPGHRTGKLHAPSLFRVPQGDPRVFTQKQEHVSKDTAVTLLCDNSGSMSGQKMHLAMIAAYALSQTLDRVKITHEVLGFTTGDYGAAPRSVQEALYEESRKSGVSFDRIAPIVMPIYKTFDERMSPLIKKRFAYAMNAQHGLNGNIDGESLQYAGARLQKRTEKRKVMLVLSDGQPAAGPKGQPHLRGVIKDLEERLRIETIGIGIMDASVSRFYPKNVVLNNVNDLPGQVMTEIKKLLL